MKLSNRIQILFLIFVVLGVYYPAIFAGFNSVDDLRMVMHLENTENFDLKRIFLPGSNFYYRPLLLLSFVADKYLWGFQPSFMHLENILLHALNTVIVFMVARRVFAKFASENLGLPLLSALLFALHPINTESVNWISGRTDLLGTFFVLLSLVALAEGLERPRGNLIFLTASLFLALGAMSKEVMLFFFPVGVFLICCWPGQDGSDPIRRGVRLTRAGIFASPFLLLGGMYLFWRYAIYGPKDTGMHHLLYGYAHDFFDTLRIFLKAFGFYVKKLFLPVPLNFVITTISDYYVWIGLVVVSLLLLAVLKFRENLFFILFCCSLFLVTPAILIALARVAWTPVAERYLYLPSVFFCISTTGILWQLCRRWGREAAVMLVLFVLLVPSLAITSDRNLIWQSNLRLYNDTALKSPDVTNVRNELAAAYISNGDNASAKEQLNVAKTLSSGKRNVSLYINHAGLELNDGKADEARAVLMEVCSDKGGAPIDVLQMLARIDEQRLVKAVNDSESQFIISELLDTYGYLHMKTGDVFFVYRSGQLFLFGGDKSKAAEYFARSYATAPAGAHYKEAAGKLATRLGGG